MTVALPSTFYDYPADLLADHEPPCLSLYQPTHRTHPDKRQDPIRYRNLLKTIDESLERRYQSRDVKPILEPFRRLATDELFWNNTLDGLAVVGARDLFRVYRLQRPVPEFVVVADSFHVKPLLRIAQSADRYQVLAVDRRDIRLFDGNRDTIDEIQIAPGVPRTLTDALGAQETERHLTVASYGGLRGPGMHHGHGSRQDEVDLDTERFFRVVDRALLEHHSRRSGLPLILVALPEHQAAFRAVSHNPYLMSEGIPVHPDSLTIESLRERSWQVMEPKYLARLSQLIEEFGTAHARGLATEDLSETAAAVVTGRVATLLVDASHEVPGRLDATTGAITYDDLAEPQVDDVLDDLGESVLRRGGQVVVVPSDRMPTRTGAAAIFRF
jgi:Bacterial archaeo-eukaryotic release factor family 3